MVTVTFYEKPGCQGNRRQKSLLVAAGHTVLARDLKAESWTADRLLAFLGELPISEWFNRNAPAIKSGQVVPENLVFEEALHRLLEDPLLIRRPLLEIDRGAGVERRVGFDVSAIAAWIGLEGVDRTVGEGCAHGPEDHGHCGGHERPAEKEGSHGCCGAH